MTRAEKFKEVFGYYPAIDDIVCNVEDWCGITDACNYCNVSPDANKRPEEWWNGEYKENDNN